MNRKGYLHGIMALSALMLISCANSELEPSNTIRVSNLPAMNLQLSQEYKKQIPIYDEAMERGIIDENFYIVERNQMEQLSRDHLDMYEGGVREQMVGGQNNNVAYLLNEPAVNTPKVLAFPRITHD